MGEDARRMLTCFLWTPVRIKRNRYPCLDKIYRFLFLLFYIPAKILRRILFL